MVTDSSTMVSSTIRKWELRKDRTEMGWMMEMWPFVLELERVASVTTRSISWAPWGCLQLDSLCWIIDAPRYLGTSPLLTNRTAYENLKRQMRAISCPIITLFFCHLSSKSISLIGISWEMEQLVEPSPGQENWRPRVRPWPESRVNSWSLSDAELGERWLSELLKHNREKNLFPPYWDSNAPAPLATSLKFP